jgi:electron transfer flavoprotein alpha subunit
VVIASGTERGNEVMAHLAALAGLPLASNVTQVKPGADGWEVIRVRWGGSLLEEAALDAPLKLVTVAPHSVEAAVADETPATEVFTPDLPDELGRTRVVERVTVTEGITLTTAPVVVSGGRGVGSAEGFAVLEELAAMLGGAVGCSRVVTNNGWRPHSDQVGQTGTRVAPNLYIACGISGAIQHWVGMMASKNVLAINNDAEAPMVTKSDYAVIGDLHPVLEAIVAEVKRRKGL